MTILLLSSVFSVSLEQLVLSGKSCKTFSVGIFWEIFLLVCTFFPFRYFWNIFKLLHWYYLPLVYFKMSQNSCPAIQWSNCWSAQSNGLSCIHKIATAYLVEAVAITCWFVFLSVVQFTFSCFNRLISLARDISYSQISKKIKLQVEFLSILLKYIKLTIWWTTKLYSLCVT